MNYSEEVALFHCEDDTLVGIVAKPDRPTQTGVIVLVGGPQYRVGSHRQFVLLSRRLAISGYAVLRFDYRGMGDSQGQQRDFQRVSTDIQAAIDALQRHIPAVRQVFLWGLCDGASAALLYCFDKNDARVRGLCLLNPWVRSPTSFARTQIKNYYWQRLLQGEFWIKLLRGGVRIKALQGLVNNLWLARAKEKPKTQQLDFAAAAETTFQQRMASAWNTFSGNIFLLLSTDDYTAKEFMEHAKADSDWKNVRQHPSLICHQVAGADHTFSSAAQREMAENLTLHLGLNLRT